MRRHSRRREPQRAVGRGPETVSVAPIRESRSGVLSRSAERLPERGASERGFPEQDTAGRSPAERGSSERGSLERRLAAPGGCVLASREHAPARKRALPAGSASLTDHVLAFLSPLFRKLLGREPEPEDLILAGVILLFLYDRMKSKKENGPAGGAPPETENAGQPGGLAALFSGREADRDILLLALFYIFF